MPMALTGVVMGALSLAVESDRELPFGLLGIASVLYLAVLGSPLAFSLYYWVLDRVAATRLSLITLGIPVVAMSVGTLALDEAFSPRTALGAVLALSGVGGASRAIPSVPRRDDRS